LIHRDKDAAWVRAKNLQCLQIEGNGVLSDNAFPALDFTFQQLNERFGRLRKNFCAELDQAAAHFGRCDGIYSPFSRRGNAFMMRLRPRSITSDVFP